MRDLFEDDDCHVTQWLRYTEHVSGFLLLISIPKYSGTVSDYVSYYIYLDQNTIPSTYQKNKISHLSKFSTPKQKGELKDGSRNICGSDICYYPPTSRCFPSLWMWCNSLSYCFCFPLLSKTSSFFLCKMW